MAFIAVCGATDVCSAGPLETWLTGGSVLTLAALAGATDEVVAALSLSITTDGFGVAPALSSSTEVAIAI